MRAKGELAKFVANTEVSLRGSQVRQFYDRYVPPCPIIVRLLVSLHLTQGTISLLLH